MNKVSKETQEQAMKIAKGTQRTSQTKEQTKLISSTNKSNKGAN